MPWKPAYTRNEARAAVRGAASWREVLSRLGQAYHGRNIATLRKWCSRWDVSVEHLPDRREISGLDKRYSEAEARAAIAESKSYAEALRRLGYCQTGANHENLKRRALGWGISTDHFDPYASARVSRTKIPLEEVLVEGSTYSRSNLKRRLYQAGLKQPRCELCGQGELWRGRAIGLILDHKNGVRDDNRLENLRILCPNCAAGLDTHCGRKNATSGRPRKCAHCGASFRARYRKHRFCSPECSHLARAESGNGLRGVPRPEGRKVRRPSRDQLLQEVDQHGFLAAGRKYGVSDTAIRKWLRQYEREAERRESERGEGLAEAA